MDEDLSPTRQEPPQAAAACWTRLRAQPSDKEIFRRHTGLWQGKATRYGGRDPPRDRRFRGERKKERSRARLAAKPEAERAEFLLTKTCRTAFNGCEYRF